MNEDETTYRLYLLEPSQTAASGGIRLLIHGNGFRTKLSVHVTFKTTQSTVTVHGICRSNTLFECIVPDMMEQYKSSMAPYMDAASTSVSPYLISAQVNLVSESVVSNSLTLTLHQHVHIRNISPQYALWSKPILIEATINLIKPRRKRSINARPEHKALHGGLKEISSLPVLVRVRRTSKRTGQVIEQVCDGVWKNLPLGLYSVEFTASMLGFGFAEVDLTFNRTEYICGQTFVPESMGYTIYRDIKLAAVNPNCIEIALGKSREIQITGEGFVKTGEIVVQVEKETKDSGRENPSETVASDGHIVGKFDGVYHSESRISCVLHPNNLFGIVSLRVSFNDGKQFSEKIIKVLLTRKRSLALVSPTFVSIGGGSLLYFYVTKLPSDEVDCWDRLRDLSNHLYVHFEGLNSDGLPNKQMRKTTAVPPASTLAPAHLVKSCSELNTNDHRLYTCPFPSFAKNVDEEEVQANAFVKCGRIIDSQSTESNDVDDFGPDTYFKDNLISFSAYISVRDQINSEKVFFRSFLPPVIKHVHHQLGPCTGNTSICIHVNYQIPKAVQIAVRFLSYNSERQICVYDAKVGLNQCHEACPSIDTAPKQHSGNVRDEAVHTIHCLSPTWELDDKALSHLTLIQVSYNNGYEFFPAFERNDKLQAEKYFPWRLADGKPESIAKVSTRRAIKQDLSHLSFTFYRNPIIHKIVPICADSNGGSLLRFIGSNVTSHSNSTSIRFVSHDTIETIPALVVGGELHCIAPSLAPGHVDIYVSFNNEEFTECRCTDTNRDSVSRFTFYASPSIFRSSPTCICINVVSTLRIFGKNLIETGCARIRIVLDNKHKKTKYKVVSARIAEGAIVCESPLLPTRYSQKYISMEASLNGIDFTGTQVMLYCFASYFVTTVSPRTGAYEFPITLEVHLNHKFVTDKVSLMLEFKCRDISNLTLYGPVQIIKWKEDSFDINLPSMNSIVPQGSTLESILARVSFDGQSFHTIGNLMGHYTMYHAIGLLDPHPMLGLYTESTTVSAACDGFQDTEMQLKVSLTLKIQEAETSRSTPSTTYSFHDNEMVTILAGHTVNWVCPPLPELLERMYSSLQPSHPALELINLCDLRHILPRTQLIMQLSTVEDQPIKCPLFFHYYQTPRLLKMFPSVGFAHSDCIIKFQFVEALEDSAIAIEFVTGASKMYFQAKSSGDEVECCVQNLEICAHLINFSYNGQHFESLRFISDADTANAQCFEQKNLETLAKFEAYDTPTFTLPPHQESRIISIGPTSGGTKFHLEAENLAQNVQLFVCFRSTQSDMFGKNTIESVVNARLFNDHTIECTTPASTKCGIVALFLSYNSQQFVDTLHTFEYYAAPSFQILGYGCCTTAGDAEVSIKTSYTSDLLTRYMSIDCPKLQFVNVDDSKVFSIELDATYDIRIGAITCRSPPWPCNALVEVNISLTSAPFAHYIKTGLQFIFYDPPNNTIGIHPVAGPVSGGTHVVLECGTVLGANDVKVHISLIHGENDCSEDGCTADIDSSIKTPNTMEPISVTTLDESVQFQTKVVPYSCLAIMDILFNGIKVTSTHIKPLRYIYYISPVIERVRPQWVSFDTELSKITLTGRHFRDLASPVFVRFQIHNITENETYHMNSLTSPPKEHESLTNLIMPAIMCCRSEFGDPTDRKNGTAVHCEINVEQVIPPGYYEIEISLNGQQYSRSPYSDASLSNYSGTPCTCPLPFRIFSSPFFLAARIGYVVGGATVTLHLGKKLNKLLLKETKCQVQFSPLQGITGGLQRGTKSKAAGAIRENSTTDTIRLWGDIDHKNSRIQCRAPCFRTPCRSVVDIILSRSIVAAATSLDNDGQSGDIAGGVLARLPPASDSNCLVTKVFSTKERQEYRAFCSPSIAKLSPSCGPTAGNTTLVIQGNNLVNTGQIFVRFRSSYNDNDVVMVPGQFSYTYPDGTSSTEPLIICVTPSVSWTDNDTVVSENCESQDPSRHNESMSPNLSTTTFPLAGNVRMQMYMNLAAEGSDTRNRIGRGEGASHVLKMTRLHARHHLSAEKSVKSHDRSKERQVDILPDRKVGSPRMKRPRASTESYFSVSVDLTFNAGEQFIAHSVPFFYYLQPAMSSVGWFPHNLPDRTTDRSSTSGQRIITLKLSPDEYYITPTDDFGGRISFYFAGLETIKSSKCRDTAWTLHDGNNAIEMVAGDPRFTGSKAKGRNFGHHSVYTMTMSSATEFDANSSLDSKSNITKGQKRLSTFQTSNTGFVPAVSAQKSISTYYAACVPRTNEIVCSVPEFVCAGNVELFFSLNSQQFVSLGTLNIHRVLSIREHEDYRLCSNIGDERFSIKCSLSTLFLYISDSDITNQTLRQERVKPASCAFRSRAGDHRSSSTIPNDQQAVAFQPGSSTEVNSNKKHAAPVWRDRVYCLIRVHLVSADTDSSSKANSYYKRAKVCVYHPATEKLLDIASLNESGMCVLDSSDWTPHTRIRAAISVDPSDGNAASCFSRFTGNFSELIRETKARKAIIIDGSCKYVKQVMDLVIVQFPTPRINNTNFEPASQTTGSPTQKALHVVLRNPCQNTDNPIFDAKLMLSTVDKVLCDSRHIAKGSDSAQFIPCCNESLYKSDFVSSIMLSPDEFEVLNISRFHIGVQFQFCDQEKKRDSLFPYHFEKDLQLIIFNENSILRHLSIAKIPDNVEMTSGSDTVSIFWMAATVIVYAPIRIDIVDRFGSSWKKILSHLEEPKYLENDKIDEVQANTVAHKYNMMHKSISSIMLQFLSTDPSVPFMIEAKGIIILPFDLDSTSMKQFLNDSTKSLNVEIESIFPAIDFDGITAISVLYEGVKFSNTITLQCYNPAKWRLECLHPPCVEDGHATSMRLRGKQFVKTGRITARFSDIPRSRFIDVPAVVEKARTLFIRVSSVRNLRNVRYIITPGSSATTLQSKRRDTSKVDKKNSSPATRFLCAIRITYNQNQFFTSFRDASASHQVSHTGVSLLNLVSWDEVIELRLIDSLQPIALTLELKEVVQSNSILKPDTEISSLEIAHAVLLINKDECRELCRKTIPLERSQFRKFTASDWKSPMASSSGIELDVSLQVSDPILNSECLQCELNLGSIYPHASEPSMVKYALYVQVSSGDYFISEYALKSSATSAAVGTTIKEMAKESTLVTGQQCVLYVYPPPTVLGTSPKVLPRSTGGKVDIRGENFVYVPNASILIRLFGCHSISPDASNESNLKNLLDSINAVTRLQKGTNEFFVRDVEGTFVSSSVISFIVPAFLGTFNVYYRVSFNCGNTFTKAVKESCVLLFTIDKVEPRGGPTSGGTYVAIHGSNINRCLTQSSTSIHAAKVCLTWLRSGQKTTRSISSAEHYPPENILYFHAPRSIFRADHFTLGLDVCIAEYERMSFSLTSALSRDSIRSDRLSAKVASGNFTQDEMEFIVYKSPSIRAITPTQLLCGVTKLEMIVPGMDSYEFVKLRPFFRARFQCQGQIHTSHVSLLASGRVVTWTPRFNVRNAGALRLMQDNTGTNCKNAAEQYTISEQHGEMDKESEHANGMMRVPKVWRRHSGVLITILRGRHLAAQSNKGTCNPYAVLVCGKERPLRTSRRDSTYDPVWNEVFEYDSSCLRVDINSARTMCNDSMSDNLIVKELMLRIRVENQLDDHQREIIGIAEISFLPVAAKSFAFRGWIPLRRPPFRKSRRNPRLLGSRAPIERIGMSSDSKDALGDIEIAVIYLKEPMPTRVYTKQFELLATAITTSKSLILNSPKVKTETRNSTSRKRKFCHRTISRNEGGSDRQREKRLRTISRLFRKDDHFSSLQAANEIVVELALNGQDFWSVAPSKCYALPPPLIATIFPTFISLEGGTTLTITGLNILLLKTVKIAFVLSREHAIDHLDRVFVVNATHQSTFQIACITPSFSSKAKENSILHVYISQNGLDYDSFKIPPALTIAASDDHLISHSSALRWDTNRLVYIVDPIVIEKECDKFALVSSDKDQPNSIPCVGLYKVPVICSIEAVVDTEGSCNLRITGHDFTDTGKATAQLTAIDDANFHITEELTFVTKCELICFISNTFEYCAAVKVAIAMNGQDYIAYKDTIRLSRSPRLVQVIPPWIPLSCIYDLSADEPQITLRGVNLLNSVLDTDTGRATAEAVLNFVHLSSGSQETTTAVFVDLEAKCTIPRTIVEFAMSLLGPLDAACSDEPTLDSVSISIEFVFAESHSSFLTAPLTLNIYKAPPSIDSISPTNGPIYGGTLITIIGRDFLPTEALSVRFTHYISTEDPPVLLHSGTSDHTRRSSKDVMAASKHSQKLKLGYMHGSMRELDINEEEEDKSKMEQVHCTASFISKGIVTCTSLSFPSEGIYKVSITLDGVVYSKPTGVCNFQVWRNWQRKQSLIASSPAGRFRSTATSLHAVEKLSAMDAQSCRDSDTMSLKSDAAMMSSNSAHLSQVLEERHITAEKKVDDLISVIANDISCTLPTIKKSSKCQVALYDISRHVTRSDDVVPILSDMARSPESKALLIQTLYDAYESIMMMERVATADIRSTGLGSRPKMRKTKVKFESFVIGMLSLFPKLQKTEIQRVWNALMEAINSETSCESNVDVVLNVSIDSLVKTMVECRPSKTADAVDHRHDNDDSRLLEKESTKRPTQHAGNSKQSKQCMPFVSMRRKRFNASWCNPVPKIWSACITTGLYASDEQKIFAQTLKSPMPTNLKLSRPQTNKSTAHNSPRIARIGQNVTNEAESETTIDIKTSEIIANDKEQAEFRKKDREVRKAEFSGDIAPMYLRFFKVHGTIGK